MSTVTTATIERPATATEARHEDWQLEVRALRLLAEAPLLDRVMAMELQNPPEENRFGANIREMIKDAYVEVYNIGAPVDIQAAGLVYVLKLMAQREAGMPMPRVAAAEVRGGDAMSRALHHLGTLSEGAREYFSMPQEGNGDPVNFDEDGIESINWRTFLKLNVHKHVEVDEMTVRLCELAEIAAARGPYCDETSEESATPAEAVRS